MNTKDQFFQNPINLRTLLLAGFIAAIGVWFLYISVDPETIKEYPTWKLVFGQLGSLFLISASVTLMWDLFNKRLLIKEILDKVRLAEDIDSSGISSISDNYLESFDWEDFFSNAKHIFLFFAYAHTWRNSNNNRIHDFLKNRNKLEIILPDLNNSTVTKDLSERFGYTEEILTSKIRESYEFFLGLRNTYPDQIKVWLLPHSPLYSFYFSDKKAVLTLYSHSKHRMAVPTFVLKKNGRMYRFIANEIDKMISINESVATQVN